MLAPCDLIVKRFSAIGTKISSAPLELLDKNIVSVVKLNKIIGIMILNKNSLQIASGTINLVMGLALAATGLNICFSSWQYAAANKIFFFLFEQLIPAEVSYEGFKNILTIYGLSTAAAGFVQLFFAIGMTVSVYKTGQRVEKFKTAASIIFIVLNSLTVVAGILNLCTDRYFYIYPLFITLANAASVAVCALAIKKASLKACAADV